VTERSRATVPDYERGHETGEKAKTILGCYSLVILSSLILHIKRAVPFNAWARADLDDLDGPWVNPDTSGNLIKRSVGGFPALLKNGVTRLEVGQPRISKKENV